MTFAASETEDSVFLQTCRSDEFITRTREHTNTHLFRTAL